MWSRWSRTGPISLFTKADWHTLARLTVNRKHGDAGHKDRTLAIWVGRGYYHFTTYTTGNPNIIQNINYKDQLDGKWNFIFFGYKKFGNNGKAKPYVLFDGKEAAESSADVLHEFVSDYLHF
jgi:hypothetical protein